MQGFIYLQQFLRKKAHQFACMLLRCVGVWLRGCYPWIDTDQCDSVLHGSKQRETEESNVFSQSSPRERSRRKAFPVVLKAAHTWPRDTNQNHRFVSMAKTQLSILFL